MVRAWPCPWDADVSRAFSFISIHRFQVLFVGEHGSCSLRPKFSGTEIGCFFGRGQFLCQSIYFLHVHAIFPVRKLLILYTMTENWKNVSFEFLRSDFCKMRLISYFWTLCTYRHTSRQLYFQAMRCSPFVDQSFVDQKFATADVSSPRFQF